MKCDQGVFELSKLELKALPSALTAADQSVDPTFSIYGVTNEWRADDGGLDSDSVYV